MSNKKLFISYCHKDKILFQEFKTHLSTLERNGDIDVLSDREILAGDLLDNEIIEDISSSDIVSFLISSDLLNSKYCMDIEFENTLKRFDSNGDVRILPIILRDCDWENSLFSKFKAIPEDGKAIVNYPHKDTAWKNVITEIRRVLANTKKARIRLGSHPVLNSKFVDFLNDTEVEFLSSNKDKVSLDDVFVFPDLRVVSEVYDFESVLENSKSFLDANKINSNILLLGDDQCGKTSLFKKLYSHFYSIGKLPVYILGGSINNSNVERILSKTIKLQYEDANIADINKDDIIVIIDDYHEIKLNLKFKEIFIEKLCQDYKHILLASDLSIAINEDEISIFGDFEKYEIQHFGYARRGELIEKWHSIGREEIIQETKLFSLIDASSKHIDSIVGRNLLPPKPIYILTILQSLETSTSRDFTLTSYGHCYQSLIQSALMKENIHSQDLDQFYNYLTELAYYLYTNKTLAISEKEFDEFKKYYSSKYIIESHEYMLEKLFKSKILAKEENRLFFKYIYIYYFYTAKYICDHIAKDEMKREIEYLANNIHVERNAYILIFLIHHSRDDLIVDEIILSALLVFDLTDEATLEFEEVSFLAEFIEEIPDLVVKVRNISEERVKRLEYKDKIEKLKKSSSSVEVDSPDTDEIEEHSILAEIHRTMRVIEVIGQILRNRSGSLPRERLEELTIVARASGLKLLKYFLYLSKNEQNSIIDFISNQFQEDDSVNEESVTLKAKKTYTLICFRVILNIIKKLSSSLGTLKLKTIFDAVIDDEDSTPAHQLVHISFLLEFIKSIPKNEIIEFYKNSESNIIAKCLLRELVVHYLYFNKVDVGDRTWISDKLGIAMRDQRYLQNIKSIKKMK